MGAFIARVHVDATWHSGPRGSATQTRASACVALRWHLYIYFFIYSGYSTYKPPIEDIANLSFHLTLYTR